MEQERAAPSPLGATPRAGYGCSRPMMHWALRTAWLPIWGLMHDHGRSHRGRKEANDEDA